MGSHPANSPPQAAIFLSKFRPSHEQNPTESARLFRKITQLGILYG